MFFLCLLSGSCKSSLVFRSHYLHCFAFSLYTADAECSAATTGSARASSINGVVRWTHSLLCGWRTRNNIIQDVTLADSLLSVMYIASHWQDVPRTLCWTQRTALGHRMSGSTKHISERVCCAVPRTSAIVISLSNPYLPFFYAKQEQKAIDCSLFSACIIALRTIVYRRRRSLRTRICI